MRGIKAYLKKDRRYVYLTGVVLAGLSLWMWRAEPSAGGFLKTGGALMYVMASVCAVFGTLSLAAFAAKLVRGRAYSQTGFRNPGMIRLSACLYWLVVLVFAVTVADRLVLRLADTVRAAVAADSNPQGFIASMVYMFWKRRAVFRTGVWNTVLIALAGTAVAFVLAVLMAFLRIQKPDRRDNDLVKFLKKLGSGFASFYISVIRGTPMMVQALIFYYAGFAIFTGSGNMTITEINKLWTPFRSGLITVALNSTAYLAEVLRGGIESIDAGQNEAARSLGMTSWQAMLRVVFPQAVKNSIPAIGNEFIINIKDSAVLSVIGCLDLMYATTTVAGIYMKGLQTYCIAAIIYLVLTYLSSRVMKAVAKKLDAPARDVPSSN